MRTLIKASLLATMLFTGASWAQNTSPVGLWKTVDDETGKPKALVRITEENGALQGKIEKLFRGPNEEQNPICTACTDSRKNQPMIGMTIVTGLKKDGDEFTGGEILDPAKGKVYKSKATLREGGQRLEVRGYIGVPVLGRSQVWQREQ